MVILAYAYFLFHFAEKKTKETAEVSGVAMSHQELWSEVSGARSLHTAPCEQVKPD